MAFNLANYAKKYAVVEAINKYLQMVFNWKKDRLKSFIYKEKPIQMIGSAILIDIGEYLNLNFLL